MSNTAVMRKENVCKYSPAIFSIYILLNNTSSEYFPFVTSRALVAPLAMLSSAYQHKTSL